LRSFGFYTRTPPLTANLKSNRKRNTPLSRWEEGSR